MPVLGSLYESVIEQLQVFPKIRGSSLGVTKHQGVYVLWLDRSSRVCLKVGIAGPRQGKGLGERLKLHYSSNPSNSVLARHLAADTTSSWAAGRNFNETRQRRAFLADNCYFQVVELPNIGRSNLKRIESFLVDKLKPTYAGRVNKKRTS